jgi:ribosome recycling factor
MAASPAFKLDDYKKRMDGALTVLTHEFGGLRTGRASSTILDPIQVEANGSVSPLNQVAGVTVPEARMISVQVWDKSVVQAVDKAIRSANLGLNPIVDGQTLRIPVPPLTGERRTELTKVAAKYAETARVAVRNVRRHVRVSGRMSAKTGTAPSALTALPVATNENGGRSTSSPACTPQARKANTSASVPEPTPTP